MPDIHLRLILLGAFGLIWLVLSMRKHKIDNFIFLTLFALMLLSPAVFPWYLLWLLPFGLRRFPIATVIFLSLSFFTYWTEAVFLKTGVRQESALIRTLEYSASLLVFIYEVYRAKKKK